MSTKYVWCAGITKIMPPKYTRGFVDITDMNSTDYYEDNALAGPVRTGTVGFEANYLSTNTQQVTDFEAAFSAGTPIGWLIQIAGTSSKDTWFGDGVISAYSTQDLTIDGKVAMTFELKTKGKPVGPVNSGSTSCPVPASTT